MADPAVAHSKKRRRSPVTELFFFCCLVDSHNPVPITIPSSRTVAELKERIKEKQYIRLKDVQAEELELFKVSIPGTSDLVQELKYVLRLRRPLHPIAKLYTIFPAEPPDDIIHIAVRLPGQAVASSPTQDRVVKSAAQRSRPSEDAINSHLLKTQKKDRADAVYNYRPLFLGGPPITIYHPVFSEFAQAMSVPTDTLEFTIDELEKAKLLMKVSCDRYEDVHARRGDLHDILVGFQSNCSVHYSNARKSSFYFPDGMKVVNCDGIKTCPAFQEIKNEIGMGGSDPMDQCECDYVKSVTSNEYAPIRNASCCPCILIGIAGPNLSINGAVFTESQLVSQRLCDNVYLGPVVEINGSLTHTMRGIRRIAQFVRAYGSAVDKLYTFYKELKLEPIGQVRPPHFDRYTVGQDSFQIIYIERLCPESAAKAVFKATVMNVASEETCTVVVKFAFSYDKQAHELLASHGLSPALKYCERVASVGNLFVVIMEWMSGIPFLQYAHAAMVPTLRTAVKMLHNSGRVFGDLRAPNVLVETDEEETQVTSLKLLDFDWCDYEGSARYPEFTNMDPDLNWHPDTRPFGLIAKAHDVYMFKKLTGMELDKQLRTN